MSINIRRDVKDSFYRYKMPKIVAKIEGKGNGIKTVIPNMSDIAKALSRPPTYPTKYFGFELGAQVKCEEKNDRYIINGQHESKKLQDLLDGFIDKFVLCAHCKNPETDLIINKNGIIRDCKACGKRSEVDHKHKLTAFIMKHPPTQPKKAKKSKKGSKSENNSASEATIPTPPDSVSVNSEDETSMRTDEEIIEMPKPVKNDDDDDDDWCVDTSPEAVAERMKEINGAVAKLAVNIAEDDDGDDDDEKDPIDEFAEYVEEEERSDKEIIKKARELGLKNDKVCTVLVQILFDEDVLEQISERSELLNSFVKNEKCQKAILGGIERLVDQNDKLLPKVAFILKAFYDEDIVEEDVLLAWGEKASKKYVDKAKSKEIRKQATPFLNWLREAEEESSDEDDEDDE
jgi:translation initiation factor 5